MKTRQLLMTAMKPPYFFVACACSRDACVRTPCCGSGSGTSGWCTYRLRGLKVQALLPNHAPRDSGLGECWNRKVVAVELCAV